ncbi:MAG TPA: TonB-dependent receptor, partial [Sphingobacteriaceae bacterium]|nr:TonB-dependent receptor [Sphingobacteriaceae bacterium]
MKLRSLITIILLSITTFSLFAQTAPVAYSLKGIAIDSVTNKPAEYVTITLKNNAKQVIRTAATKADGFFNFEKLVPGKYTLSVISIGYRPKTIPVDLTDNTKQAIELGNIFISPQNNQLAAVSITGSRPIVKQEIDRISYDLEADPESKGSTVMEMMRKVPMLSVDGDDNVLLKGNSNYKIFINGKPSSMMERNAKDILKTMPASSIKNIEVIFSPSSKYDAEGIGGIINIVTTRKIDNGYNGSLNVNEQFPVGGPGAGGTFTFKQGKFGISSLGGINFSNSPLVTSANSRLTTGSPATTLSQSFSKESDNNNGYAGTNFSFEIDSLNLISGQFNYNGSRITGSSNQISKLDNGSGLTQDYDLSGNNTAHGKGADGALNYQLGFKSDKTRLLTFSYQNIWYENNQLNSIDISNPPDYQQTNEGSSSEQTVQIDYVHPVKKVMIEAGLKEIIRNNKS